MHHHHWTLLMLFCRLISPSRSQFEEQISHGLAASENQFPFHAVITDPKNQVTCGGTFISRRHVLTAAHCVQVPSKSEIKVHGAMIEKSDSKRISAEVSKVDVHATYDSETFTDDIAIITLTHDLEEKYGRRIQAMKLPEQDEEYQINSYGLICGFGETQDGNLSTNLLFARERIAEPDTCNDYTNFRPNLMMCAFNTYSESCRGDSGGGLIVRQRLVGILIFGSDYACGSHQPTSYVRVSAYVNWIKSVTKEIVGVRKPSPPVMPGWWTIVRSSTAPPIWPDEYFHWDRQPPTRYNPSKIPAPVPTAPPTTTRRPTSASSTRARYTPRPRTRRPVTHPSTTTPTPTTTATTTTPRPATHRPATHRPTWRPHARPTQIHPSLVSKEPEVNTGAPTVARTELPFKRTADPRLGAYRGWARNCKGNKRWGWTSSNPVTTYAYDCTCVYEVRYERGNKEMTQAEPFSSCQRNTKGPEEEETSDNVAVYRDASVRKYLGRYNGKFRSCKGTTKTRGNHVISRCICEYTEKFEKGNYVFQKEEPYEQNCANSQSLVW